MNMLFLDFAMSYIKTHRKVRYLANFAKLPVSTVHNFYKDNALSINTISSLYRACLDLHSQGFFLDIPVDLDLQIKLQNSLDSGDFETTKKIIDALDAYYKYTTLSI